MALKDEIFKKHIQFHSKAKKRYSHFRPFDDPQDKYLQTLNKIIEHEPIVSENLSCTTIKSENKLISSVERKLDTNRTQTRHKLDTEPDTNRTQTRHKLDTNRTQTRHKLDTEPDTKLDTNWTQNPVKPNEKISISMLSGIQRSLLFLIYEKCKLQGSRITPPLSFEHICKHTNLVKGSVKTSLQRLVEKKYLIRESYKNGRSGWIQLRLPDRIYQELVNLDISGNWTQTRHKLDTEPDTEPDTTASVVSSSEITTTTVPRELREIDYSPLEEIGFTDSHLFQISSEYKINPTMELPLSVIQDSINALAFDLKHNNVAKDFKNSPVVVLTNMLKKGKPYSSKTPDKFVTPQQEALSKYLAAKEVEQQKTAAMEQRAQEVAFTTWLATLPEEELMTFVGANEFEALPDKIRLIRRKEKALAEARKYFNLELWPSRREEILKSN